MRKVKLFKPFVSWYAVWNVIKTLRSSQLAEGPRVKEFEEKFAKRFGLGNVVAVNSGTAALELAYELAGIGEGDEVITPILTCLYQNETVLLSDGRKMSIKKMVNQKYNGEVVSYNLKTGEFENKKVIGWHKNPIAGRKWYRVYFENSIVSRSQSGRKGVWLTENHPILTKRGYILAKDLKKNDMVATSFYSLNDKQKELFEGSMLGDGYIRFGRSDNSSCRFGFLQQKVNEDYVNLKIKALNSFAHQSYNKGKYKQSGEAVGAIFRSSPIWNLERKNWYKNGKKILPTSFREITLFSLAVWYMDDGSRQGNSAVICSESFTLADNERLISILNDSLGVKASIQSNYRHGKLVPRIYIGNGHNGGKIIKKANAFKFFRMVAPYIPESLRYKLPEDIRLNCPFNPKLWELNRSRIFYDSVSVIKNKKPLDVKKHLNWVYCIDVEDNHNFISKNIILHNCTATNIPFVRRKAKIIFADIDRDLNISVEDVKRKITAKTKAIIFVHFGGNNRGLKELLEIAREKNIILIEDAAQAVISDFWGKSDYTCVSFQAIKTLTTGDGGALLCKKKDDYEKAKKLRWFGYDREKKQKFGDVDLKDAGYKYHMNDISASIGLGNLKVFDKAVAHHRKLMTTYKECGITAYPWFALLLTEKRDELRAYLKDHGIESGMQHYRNDIYTIFGGRKNFPIMDEIENKYLLLPLHMGVTISDVKKICNLIKIFNESSDTTA
ncbi:MAG: aminotransferase class V-fold PLP-dependent enzyme [bacterium]|nr:aminotransferase class V-fold PLP-dependent enzyme [bacterium]